MRAAGARAEAGEGTAGAAGISFCAAVLAEADHIEVEGEGLRFRHERFHRFVDIVAGSGFGSEAEAAAYHVDVRIDGKDAASHSKE